MFFNNTKSVNSEIEEFTNILKEYLIAYKKYKQTGFGEDAVKAIKEIYDDELFPLIERLLVSINDLGTDLTIKNFGKYLDNGFTREEAMLLLLSKKSSNPFDDAFKRYRENAKELKS